MNISNLSPLVHLPQPEEQSSLRSPRDSNSIYKMWRKLQESIERVNQLSQINNQLSREFKRLNDRSVLGFDFFPFKIYTVPDNFRPTTNGGYYTASANWRTVRVRGGLVLTSVVSTGSYVNGTDMMQNYSYYNMLPNIGIGSSYDIQVPINTPQYWFWIENSGSNSSSSISPYFVRYGSNPASASSGNPNPWTTFPSSSANYIPIGYVDTSTSSSVNIAYVNQMLTTDVLSVGGSSNWFKGDFNDSASYDIGDGIRVRPLCQYPHADIVPGTWICNFAVPSNPLTGSTRTGSIKYYPILPEPSNTPHLLSGSWVQGKYWTLLSMLPQGFNSCTPSGLPTVEYIDSYQSGSNYLTGSGSGSLLSM